MDTPQPILTLEDSIKQVVRNLPIPIKHYLAEGKYSLVAQSLATKYGLDATKGSILEKEILLLLTGIDTPDEFSQTLIVEGGLDKQTINKIMQDVNGQIFIPLRDQIQGAAKQQAQAGAPHPAGVPQSPHPTPPRAINLPPPSVIIQANPSMPMRPQQQDYISKVAPKYVPPPRPVAPRPSISAIPARPTPPPQKPMSSPQMLEDHEEPHMEFRHPVSRAAPPPPNLPGAMPPPIPRSVTPASPSAPRPLTPRPSVVPYSTDPYREPFDEPNA